MCLLYMYVLYVCNTYIYHELLLLFTICLLKPTWLCVTTFPVHPITENSLSSSMYTYVCIAIIYIILKKMKANCVQLYTQTLPVS